MLQQLTLDLRLHKNNILVALLAELGAFLLGVIMVCVILRLDSDPGGWFCMGTVMALIACAVVTLLTGAFGYYAEFQLALSMGRTRTAFMGSYALRLLLQLAVSYVLVLLLYRAELALYPIFFPAYENEVQFTFLTNWKLILTCALGLLILSMFIGAIYGRWGKKSLWVFWVIWLFCCFVLPRLFDDEPGEGVLDQAALGVRNVFATVPLNAWIVFGAALAVGMISTTAVLGRKQMVK